VRRRARRRLIGSRVQRFKGSWVHGFIGSKVQELKGARKVHIAP
jgi:hypothetical protein